MSPASFKLKCSAFMIAASLSAAASAYGPTGVYSTSVDGNDSNSLYSKEIQGAVIRVGWSQIEPEEGVFDFSAIDDKVAMVKAAGKKYSLAIAAGPSTPAWLTSSLKSKLTVNTPGGVTQIPKYNEKLVHERLSALAFALAERYDSDPSLALVYTPQMSVDGVKSDFSGNTDAALAKGGFQVAPYWVDVRKTAKAFSDAFREKPIVIDVRSLFKSPSLIREFSGTCSPTKGGTGKIGLSVSWLSGKTGSEKELFDFLAQKTRYKNACDVYGQLVGSVSTPNLFANNDITTAIKQARDLGIKYLEVSATDAQNSSLQSALGAFNDYATKSNVVTPFRAVNFRISDDSGASKRDFLTNVENQALKGQLGAIGSSFTRNLVFGEKLEAKWQGDWVDVSSPELYTVMAEYDIRDIALTPGANHVDLRIKNYAGIYSPEVRAATIMLDQTPPAATISYLQYKIDGAKQVRIVGIKLDGTLEKGAKIEMTTDDGTTWRELFQKNASRNEFIVSRMVTSSMEGLGQVKFRITDESGNELSGIKAGKSMRVY